MFEYIIFLLNLPKDFFLAIQADHLKKAKLC